MIRLISGKVYQETKGKGRNHEENAEVQNQACLQGTDFLCQVTIVWLPADWPGTNQWALESLLFSSSLAGWDVRLGKSEPNLTQRDLIVGTASRPGKSLRPC